MGWESVTLLNALCLLRKLCCKPFSFGRPKCLIITFPYLRHASRCVEASCVVAYSRYKYCPHLIRLARLPRFSLIPLHPASAVASPCSRRRVCPLVYTTVRYSDVVAMQVCLIDGAGQLSLSSSLKVKSTASAAHARSRPSAVVLAQACRRAQTRTTCIC